MSDKSASLKILVCGDVEGNFRQLFSRVAGIQKKAGTFDMLFCVGNFFAADNKSISEEWNLVLSGEIKVPIATFVLGPNETSQEKYYPDLNGSELCPNITYLGKRGLYRGSSGLSVAYLSGIEAAGTASTASSSSTSSSRFTKEDMQALCTSVTAESGFRGVDILLTSQCPRGFDKYATKSPVTDEVLKGSELISQLALTVKPRYHFSSLQDFYYERQPYRNHQILRGEAQHTTRFLCLARHGNTGKHKWMYAFNIQPMREMPVSELVKQSEDVTESPYKHDQALLADNSNNPSQREQFFYDPSALEKGGGRGGRGGKRGHQRGGSPPHSKKKYQQPPPQARGPCWFCLASPEVEKHLVTSIGDHCYIAMAKGGLTPHHTLITTIAHYKCAVELPEPVLDEVNRYKSALRKCFKKEQGQDVVFFERNYKTQHLQIQAVPIPAEVRDRVENCFITLARKQHIDLIPINQSQQLSEMVSKEEDYFCVELGEDSSLFCQISDRRFPLNFAREALAQRDILDMTERINWRDCMTTKEEETDIAADFRKLFSKYDFTL